MEEETFETNLEEIFSYVYMTLIGKIHLTMRIILEEKNIQPNTALDDEEKNSALRVVQETMWLVPERWIEKRVKTVCGHHSQIYKEAEKVDIVSDLCI